MASSPFQTPSPEERKGWQRNLRSLKKYQMTLLIFPYGLKLIWKKSKLLLCYNGFHKKTKINKVEKRYSFMISLLSHSND